METTAVYREEQKMWIKIKRERERGLIGIYRLRGICLNFCGEIKNAK